MSEETHPRRIGQYEILGVIGKGAMGKVYKGVQPSLNRIVAIKVLPPELADDERVERFSREAKAVALLNHPNVVQIIDKDQDGDQVFFVMEYVAGTSLEAVMRKRRLSLPEAVRVFKAVCRGMAAAHKKEIVHRDLSPRNVLVTEDLLTAKIADFGISRVESISREMGTLSTSEVSMGTLHYMAPEQAQDMASSDHRSDIYSLGVLLYEMLTGRVPVGRFSLPSQLNSEVPPEVDPVVLRCLEADPADRYQEVSKLLADVERLEDHLKLGLVNEVRGLSQSTSKIIIKSARTRAVQIAVGLAVLAGLAAAGVWIVRSKAPEPVPTAGGDALVAVKQDRSGLKEREDRLPALVDLDVPESSVPTEDAEEATVQVETPVKTQQPAARGETEAEANERRAAAALEGAIARMNGQEWDRAIGELDALMASEPPASIGRQALLLLGKAHERKRDDGKARTAYLDLDRRYPGSTEAAEGLYRLASKLQKQGGRDRLREARTYLDKIANDYSSSNWAPRALIDKAVIEKDAKWHVDDPVLKARVPAALVSYRQFVAKYPSHAQAPMALNALGDLYEDEKLPAKAAATFETLARRFPANPYDAWWKAAQVYDRRLDQFDKAITAYENVPKSSKRFPDAQRRIVRLKRK